MTGPGQAERRLLLARHRNPECFHRRPHLARTVEEGTVFPLARRGPAIPARAHHPLRRPVAYAAAPAARRGGDRADQLLHKRALTRRRQREGHLPLLFATHVVARLDDDDILA